MFTPSRFTLARERRRLSKKALAEAIGVTPHTVLRYESGVIVPPAETVERTAEVLNFPVEFFFEPDVERLPEDAASFRSMSTISAKERTAALAAGSLAYLLSDWVEERFGLPAPDLIELDGDDPCVAAQSVREAWGLGAQPIKNMVHLLEAKGVRLFSMAENTMTVDAFSVWRGERPFVFLNTMKSAERSRYDAGHELGHLVLHKHGGPHGRDAEDEADAFSSEFLMPRQDVEAVLPRVHTLNQIIEAKKRWGVSVMALIVRLGKLHIITEWQYRNFVIQATERKYRKSEPYGLPRELSVVWKKVLTALWSERVTKEDISRDLRLPPEELESLLFGLAGLRPEEGAIQLRPPLRLISN
ncbi:MAG TPA: XRE family transcriptional regulator [Phenylobacterium sp.]|jgi:Zn-dependent peptidase ImmA (M78 family)/transcriptional regulator with XRE-family HTH domain|nr:XRE family transcriptional regulator [Phenylobacterium sp.]